MMFNTSLLSYFYPIAENTLKTGIRAAVKSLLNLLSPIQSYHYSNVGKHNCIALLLNIWVCLTHF